MKLYLGRFLSCFIILSLYGLSTCKSKEDDPLPQTTEQEKVTDLLTAGTGTWVPPVANGVTVDGFDVTEELFSGFTIRFVNGQLFTTGTTPVWLRQDTWQFKSSSSTIFIRGQDDSEVNIENISETELRLTLVWTKTTFGGRTKSLPGRYTFTLNK